MSDDILETWRELGGVHLQIGRKYPFMETRQAPVRGLFDDLKQLHDPDGIMSRATCSACARATERPGSHVMHAVRQSGLTIGINRLSSRGDPRYQSRVA
jgi:hypothetical protein